MKRRYAFAQMYELTRPTKWWSEHVPQESEAHITPSFESNAILELNPGWTIDTMAQKARDYALEHKFYAFTLHRATKGSGGWNTKWRGSYHHVIDIRPMEILGWT